MVGNGLMGDSFRFHVDYDRRVPHAPASVIGKFATREPAARITCAEAGVYRTEVRFYQEIAPTIAMRAPSAYYAEIDEPSSDMGLILEDMGPARGGNQLLGATVEDIYLALKEAAALHGPRWNDPALKDIDWLHANRPIHVRLIDVFESFMATFHERYEAVLEPEFMAVCDRLTGRIGDFLLRTPNFQTIVHTDYRLDNMLFDAKGGMVPLAVLDWQTVTCNAGPLDVAYLLGLNLPPHVRRELESDFLAFYLDQLGRHGVRHCSPADLEHEYRIGAFYGLFTAIVGSSTAKRTPRGDAMFMVMARGAATQMLDLDTLNAL
ncbi:MAG: phosphotransferase [Pigmentiphaga sp.]